ncbi:hypothetical protein Tco_0674820 [Tanacetum coccineum]
MCRSWKGIKTSREQRLFESFVKLLLSSFEKLNIIFHFSILYIDTVCCDDIHSCLRLAFPPWRGVTDVEMGAFGDEMVMDHHEGRKTEEFVEDPMGDGRLPMATHDAVIEPELLDVTCKDRPSEETFGASIIPAGTIIAPKVSPNVSSHGRYLQQRFSTWTIIALSEFLLLAMCPNPLMNILEAKSKLLEAAKLHVHIGLNTYLGKINTHVLISSYELSTLNSASNIVLEGNWVSHR